MKKPSIKHKHLIGLTLTILALIVYVQPTTPVPVKTASANQTINASSMELSSEELDLDSFSPNGTNFCSQAAIVKIASRPTITNNCNGSLTIAINAAAPASPISFSYRASEDFTARTATLTDIVTMN